MFDTAWNQAHLTSTEVYDTIAKLDAQCTMANQEKFILVGMRVPWEE